MRSSYGLSSEEDALLSEPRKPSSSEPSLRELESEPGDEGGGELERGNPSSLEAAEEPAEPLPLLPSLPEDSELSKEGPSSY
jgi:hypothetical protein